MKTIWHIFRRDIRSLATHFFALMVALAITLLPALYAWLNIYSNWDPYGNTGNISIAVASRDKGYITKDGERINEGRDLIDSLKESVSINWVPLDDADAAVDGVYAGDYYAAVVIEEQYSYKLHHMLNGWSGKPTITYYQNDKKNAVATKITDTAVEALRQRITENYLNVLFGRVFQEAGALSDKLDETDPEGTLLKALKQAGALLQSCSETMNAFSAAPSLTTDGAALDALIKKMNSNSIDGIQLDGVAELDRKMFAVLEQVNEALVRARQAVDDYIAGNGDEALLSAADQAIASAAEAAGNMGQYLHDWSVKIASSGTPQCSQAAERAEELSQQFYALQERLLVLTPLTEIQGDVAQLVLDALAQAERVGQLISQTLIPTLEDLRSNTQQVVARAQETLDGLQGTAVDIQKLLVQADATMDAVGGSMDQANQGIGKAAEKLSRLLSRLSDQDGQEYLDTLIELLGGDPAVYGEYFAQVVQTQVEAIYPVDSYGSAMAPFYTVLAIWVGGVMLVAVVKTHARRDGLLNPTQAQLFFGRYMLFMLISQLQAAVIVTGDLVLLGVQCQHPGLLYLTGALTSLTFSLLIYALTVSFADVGKAIVVVVMVLQIAGSSGTFPVELLPSIYQKIYRVFPFPYAIDAMRECMFGMYGSAWLLQIGRLLIFAAAALLIGLMVRRPFIGLNNFMEKKLEETEIL